MGRAWLRPTRPKPASSLKRNCGKEHHDLRYCTIYRDSKAHGWPGENLPLVVSRSEKGYRTFLCNSEAYLRDAYAQKRNEGFTWKNNPSRYGITKPSPPLLRPALSSRAVMSSFWREGGQHSLSRRKEK